MPESLEMPAKIRLMYYLWKKRAHRGSKTELAKELGYADETTVSKHLCELENTGYIEEIYDDNGRTIRLTSKGKDRILMLTLPNLLISTILAIGIVYVLTGFWMFFGFTPGHLSLTASGFCLVILYMVLQHIIRKIEKDFISI